MYVYIHVYIYICPHIRLYVYLACWENKFVLWALIGRALRGRAPHVAPGPLGPPWALRGWALMKSPTGRPRP